MIFKLLKKLSRSRRKTKKERKIQAFCNLLPVIEVTGLVPFPTSRNQHQILVIVADFEPVYCTEGPVLVSQCLYNVFAYRHVQDDLEFVHHLPSTRAQSEAIFPWGVQWTVSAKH
jgi:hypothetical protein